MTRLPENPKIKRLRAHICWDALRLTNYSTDISNMKNAFLLFKSEDILKIIVTETNRKAEAYYDKLTNEFPNKTKVYGCIDSWEMQAYIGLLLILALHGYEEAGDILWWDVITYCKQITSFICFDNFETRPEKNQ